MAATVQIHEMTSASTGVDKTNGTVRFKSADETTVDTNNRLQIPGSGNTYSYTKQLQFYFATAPSVDIQNLKAYSSGTNPWTGVTVQYDVQTGFSTNVNTDIAGTDLFTATSAAPIDLGVGPHTGTGYKGNILRLQMVVSSTASSGTLTAETLTLSYDES